MKLKPQSSQLTMQSLSEFNQYLSYMPAELFGMLRIKAPVQQEENEEEQRVPVDLVCAIDTSGSMSGSKMELLKKTMKFMIDQLKPEDRLGITTYSDGLGPCLPLTNLNEEGKKKARQFCESMRASGMTNLSAGLFRAVQMLQERSEKAEVSSIMLMTDGIVNRGVTQSQKIVDMLKGTCKERGSPVPYGTDITKQYSINSLGYGHGHDVAWIKKISDCCNGMYFDIAGPDVVASAFINILGGLLSTVCSKIKITLETGSDSCTLSKVHSGAFASKELVKGKKWEITMHDLQSEEQKDICFEIQMSKIDKADPSFKYVKASIAYTDHMLEMDCKKNIVGYCQRVTEMKKQEPNKEVDEQRNRIEAQNAVQEAIELSKKGQFEEGRKRIQETMDMVKDSASALLSADYCTDMLQAQEKMNTLDWSDGGYAEAENVSHGWAMQRSNALDRASGKKYANKKRMALFSLFSA